MLTPEAELAAIEAAQDSVETIDEFVARIAPKMYPIPWHLRQVLNLFELSRHQEVYATISLPPRHGKTTSIAMGLAYRILYDPACLNFFATFGDGLSVAVSRKIRKLVRSTGAPLAHDAANVHDWQTPLGGGLKATSVGGDVTGRGCNGGVIVGDDLIKGRKQGESKLVRDDAWDWLRDDLMSRLEPGASMIVNMTRWHEDDPIGRLKRDGLGIPWVHVELPAVRGLDGRATDERDDPEALALWLEGGYGLDRLAQIRLRGEHGWHSLYQGQPTPRGGGVFKRAWVQYLDEAPRGGTVIRRWDLAASTERDSAYTVGGLVQLVDRRLIVQDIRRGQWSPHDVDEQILQTAHADGKGIPIRLPQDPGQAGKSQKSYLAKLLEGYDVRFERETGSKELRFDPVAAQAQAGNFFVVRAPWNEALVDELESFPRGRTKDQADVLSAAYSALLQRKTPKLHGGWTGA